MFKRIFRFLRGLPPSRALSAFSKRVKPPAFEGHTLYEVSVFFGRGLNRGGLRSRASSMAYNYFIAIFPAIIFLFTLLPYIPIKHFQDALFETIREIMPNNAFLTVQDTVYEILHHQHSGLLSIGFIAALYFSTNGFTSMMGAFNKSIHIREVRPAWKQQLIALGLVFFLTIILIVAIGLIIGSELLLKRTLQYHSTQHYIIFAGRWLVIGILFMFTIAVYYRVAPAKKLHGNFFSPGVWLATSLIIVTSILFAWYINNFGKYNKLYGSIGSVIVVLVWIYYNSMMLLIGFELDASIAGARENRRSLLEQAEAEHEREENA
ncbi:MAG: YihY/virulence factor BrkB family protein [Bacteroidetes bacterium]|nr:YihY/virulence factor BrkB family protein [Bacteroidota bacterium]